MSKDNYCVYVLTLKKEPIYIGMTSNLKQRISKHKGKKYFDGFIKLESFESKEEALIAERTLIKFFSVFENEKITNAKYQSLEAYINYL